MPTTRQTIGSHHQSKINMIFYYSGCGNSRWAAKELSERMHQPLLFIPEEMKGPCLYHLKKDEPLGFVFPIYAWRPPQIVRQFVERMKIEVEEGAAQTAPYTFMVCTCADSAGYADKIFRRALHRKGLPLDAAISITMPKTYINLPGFGLDDPQAEHEKRDLAATNMPLIASFLNHGDQEWDITRGKCPWFTSTVEAWFFEHVLISDRPFRVESSCIGCGKCAEVCPVGNITMKEGRPQWHGKCLSCMSCYHYCPENAIQWGRMTKGKGQYHFPEEGETSNRGRGGEKRLKASEWRL